MTYYGDFATGATVRLPWNTNSAAGASITRTANGTVKVWKDSSDVERTSAVGITDNEDWDGNAGIHLTTIDLSDNTDAGFYAAAHDYHVAFVGQTIDGETVNAFIGSFSIQNRYVPASVSVGTGGITTASFAAGAIDAAAIAANAIGASELAADAVSEIADGIMVRATSNFEASSPVKSLGTAVIKLTHAIESAGGTLTMFRSDGTTPHATQTETTDAAAVPVTELTGAV